MKSTRTTMVLVILVAAVSFGAGAWVRIGGQSRSTEQGRGEMKTLTIKWQRLVGDSGQTCDRCGTTQREVRKAHALLRKSLSPLGINVVLEEKTLDKAVAGSIAESNRIWIAGKPLEKWLGATPGASDCASCGSLCGSATTGNVACRTVILNKSVYEAIPSELILRAGLLAAAEIAEVRADQPCCPGASLLSGSAVRPWKGQK